MICKWCGNSLSASQTTCKRCGKTVPALSDCGGFYDLVPNARNAAGAQNAPVQSVPVQNAPVTHPAAPTKKKSNHNYLLLGAAAVIAVAFILLFISLFTLQGRIVWLTNRIAALEDALDEISDIVVIPSGDEDPDPTDPGASNPGASNPKPTDPKPTDPEPAGSKPVATEPSEPEATEGESVATEPTGNLPEND